VDGALIVELNNLAWFVAALRTRPPLPVMRADSVDADADDAFSKTKSAEGLLALNKKVEDRTPSP
jgi:hypothetical protein